MKLSTVLACAVTVLLVEVATAGLLRVPKVYNALITTNEKLVPSRAIPISAPVFQPVGLGPAVPAVVVTSPYIAVNDEESKPNNTEEVVVEPLPEVEDPQKPPVNKVNRTNLIPLITPFSLPVAYYNSLAYYHNVWPYTYSSVSPGSFVFTAPFTYPNIFGSLYGSLPWAPLSKQPASDVSSTKDTVPSAPEEARDEADKESVSIEANS